MKQQRNSNEGAKINRKASPTGDGTAILRGHPSHAKV